MTPRLQRSQLSLYPSCEFRATTSSTCNINISLTSSLLEFLESSKGQHFTAGLASVIPGTPSHPLPQREISVDDISEEKYEKREEKGDGKKCEKKSKSD
jgi:hypothetical protein